MRALLILSFFLASNADALETNDFRGTRFIGFDRFDSFETVISSNKVQLRSGLVFPQLVWNELVASWNFRGEATNEVTIEAQAVFTNRASKWYNLGKWSLKPAEEQDRTSLRGQRDEDGTVQTDILKLKEAALAVAIRVTLSAGTDTDDLNVLGLKFSDSLSVVSQLEPNKAAWGKVLNV